MTKNELKHNKIQINMQQSNIHLLSELHQKKIGLFISKNKKNMSRIKRIVKPDMQQIINSPLIRKLQENIIFGKRLSQIKLIEHKNNCISNDQKTLNDNMILIAKKIQSRLQSNKIQINGGNCQVSHYFKDDKISYQNLNSRFQQIQQKQTMPQRYKSLFSTRNFIKQDKSMIVEDRQSKYNQCYYFMILSNNNNQDLVRQIFKRRKNWKQLKKGEVGIPNFKWLAGQYDASLYRRMNTTNSRKKMINQFQFHSQITTKNGLIKNLQIYNQTKKQEIFTMTPITFAIDFDDQYCQFYLKKFLNFFFKHLPKKNTPGTTPPKNPNITNKINNFLDSLKNYLGRHSSEIKKKINPLSKPIVFPQYFTHEGYMWLLKPTGLNRGRGIELFDNLSMLQRLLLNYLEKTNQKKKYTQIKQKVEQKIQSNQTQNIQQVNPEEQTAELKKAPQTFVLSKGSFVIQKYIEKPLLVNGRKFDIRVWVLLNYDFNLYFFKQGYLRTSSEQYSMDINNYFIHLTNNAVQKYSKQYGSFEKGNQLSFSTFKQILKKQNKQQKYFEIIEKIKQYCYVSLNSVKNKLNPRKRNYCFQIFGFDYIVDQTYKVWLIEVNNNPCIQLSSQLLSQLIPRMLNDAFKLSVDEIFPHGIEDKQKNEYSVDGYNNKQNMWEKLGMLSPNCQYGKK